MSVELLASEKYIKQSLLAGGLLPSGAGVYAGVIPEGAALPAVLMSRQSATDTNGGGGERLLTQPIYFIRGVVDETCLDALGPLALAIDAAFRLTTDTPPSQVDGVIVRGAQRLEPMIGDVTENGETYTYAGGLYRIFCYTTDGYSSATVLSLPPAPSVQAQLDALSQELGELQMSFRNSAFQYNGKRLLVTLTATTTLTKPAGPTDYLIDTTAGPVVVTLWPSTGDGSDARFFKSAGPTTNAASFALTAGDTTGATLANTVLTNIGDEQGWEEVGANKWGAV